MVPVLVGYHILLGERPTTGTESVHQHLEEIGRDVPGADLLVAYDPASQSYTPESVLVPGQGAWAYSEDGAVTVNTADGRS